ncbi:MAG TPA: NAD(P)/FAD-dependent oxidoreductase [Gemmatimonadaceae bacterium]|nr:NAD(P)/FAD-dependent oxidoreductase [Gemmatimonadaceae bacterium]
MSDVIIVGGGLSGLAAAYELAQHGRTATIVEARTRLGGRVLTVDHAGTPLELGAEWIGPGPVRDVLERSGATVYEPDGRYVRARSGDTERGADMAEPHGALTRALALPGADRTLTEALSELDFTRGTVGDGLEYVEGFHAADPDDVGIRWIALTEAAQTAGASSYRCAQGAGRAVDFLTRVVEPSVPVLLDSEVTRIEWSAGSVTVTVKGNDGPRTLAARAAIITVPLPVLSALHIDPDVPRVRDALGLLRMGHAMKVVLAFDAPFWLDIDGFSNVLFMFRGAGEFPTFWRGDGNVPTLNAWAGGPRARRLAALSDPQLIEHAAAGLAAALGVGRRDVDAHVVAAHVHNWSADRFAGGAYSYGGVNALDAYPVLAEPVDGTLFFAGEAAAGGGYNASMEGAMKSGTAAARSFLVRK